VPKVYRRAVVPPRSTPRRPARLRPTRVLHPFRL
jgi:hypothetical protein